jgi:outer membrane lipoprotein-sorting protein
MNNLKHQLMRLLIILIGSSSSLLFAQGPKQARYLLEQVSKKIEKQKNMRFEFKYVLENNEEQIRQETEGKVTLAGDRYKLDFLEIIQLFDGEKIYTIVPENEEITVSTPEDSEEINVNPSQILNFYKEGYDYQWDIYQRVMGRNIQFIKLIPSEENTDIKYLLLGIDVDQNSIYRLIEIGNGKTTTTLTIKNQEENITLPPYFFEFNVGDYPNYYLNN